MLPSDKLLWAPPASASAPPAALKNAPAVTAGAGASGVPGSAPRWSALHPDVLVNVLGFCNAMDVAQAAQVCRAWRPVASSKPLWADLVRRRFNISVTQRKTRYRFEVEPSRQAAGRDWRRAYRDWHRERRMPRGAMANRISHVFARGGVARLDPSHSGIGCPTGVAVSVWVTVAHSPDTGLRRPPAAALAALEAAGPVPEMQRWLQLRVVVQNVCGGAASEPPPAGSRVPPSRWCLAPVLVSAMGARLRLKDGGSVQCLPLAGPAVVAFNGQSLRATPPADGAAVEAASAADRRPVLAHVCAGVGCVCSAGRRGAARALGVLDWALQDPAYVSGAAATPSAPVQSVILGAEEFAVLDLWAPFDGGELRFEPEAMERCESLELPVTRGDGVGHGATARARFVEGREMWSQYEWLVGGALCLRT